MSWRPKQPCTWPGCGQLTDHGRCEQHRRQFEREQQRRDNDETREFYNSRPWRQCSKQHLQDEPLCRICQAEGRLEAAVMTDHIVPIKDGGDRRNSRNLQSLCASCHSRKSAGEGSRFGRRAAT